MATLTYSMMVSLDGYVAGPSGEIVGAITDEVHAFANREVERQGTHLYGRRMYEAMVYWETADARTDRPRVEREFARIWKNLDKIVYSSTLATASSARTRIERTLDLDEIRTMKSIAEKELGVAGPTLAHALVEAGLVDEFSMYVTPVIVGGGTPYLRDTGRRIDLELVEEHRFRNGVVFLRYAVR